jgi:hypothetical protein
MDGDTQPFEPFAMRGYGDEMVKWLLLWCRPQLEHLLLEQDPSRHHSLHFEYYPPIPTPAILTTP